MGQSCWRCCDYLYLMKQVLKLYIRRQLVCPGIAQSIRMLTRSSSIQGCSHLCHRGIHLLNAFNSTGSVYVSQHTHSSLWNSYDWRPRALRGLKSCSKVVGWVWLEVESWAFLLQCILWLVESQWIRSRRDVSMCIFV